MTSAHVLVVMGSGETTPTMVTPHQRLFARLGPQPRAVVLDTPYGFQENADELSARTLAYFAHNVGAEVEVATLRRPDRQPAVEVERAQAAVTDADWVFLGPGSPSYLVRQLAATRVGTLLRERVGPGGHGATVVSSAAAAVIGSHAVPVYELYKAGHDPFWLEGLGLLQAIGLDAVLVPHFDNAEGGTHDTRYCYLGERRLQQLVGELPDGTWVCGVDEHTAMVVELATGEVSVVGRGGVTVRRRDGGSTVVPSGERTTLAAMQAAGTGAAGDDALPPSTSASHDAASREAVGHAEDPLAEAVARLAATFAAATDGRDAEGATQAVLDLERLVRDWQADPTQGTGVDRAVTALRGMVTRLGTLADGGMADPVDVVGPFVELLVSARTAARDSASWAIADQLRDGLTALGVELRDGPDGTTWTLQR